jgi:hypothetical protein
VATGFEVETVSANDDKGSASAARSAKPDNLSANKRIFRAPESNSLTVISTGASIIARGPSIDRPPFISNKIPKKGPLSVDLEMGRMRKILHKPCCLAHIFDSETIRIVCVENLGVSHLATAAFGHTQSLPSGKLEEHRTQLPWISSYNLDGEPSA